MSWYDELHGPRCFICLRDNYPLISCPCENDCGNDVCLLCSLDVRDQAEKHKEAK